MGSCLFLSNRCTFALANQLSVRYIPTTELDIFRFRAFSLGELVWHLITQVNNIDLSTYINILDLRRSKRRRFIPCLVYALVYHSISINLVNLATLSPWSDSVFTHTCSPFLSKPLLRCHMTVETGILINL